MVSLQNMGRLAGVAMAASLAFASTSVAAAPGGGSSFKKANEAKRTADDREGALDSYVNPDTDDIGAQIKILLQETYVTQQRMILNQFIAQYGDRITLRTVMYKSGDILVPGHVFTPKSMAPGARYPVVVLVHGGFHERLDYPFFPIIDRLINEGYVVIFPEYRGSRGYGADYYQNDYGVTDVADVLAAAEFMATESYVDSSRMAIVGESRGGMITLAAIEQQPKRFQAAVDIVGLTDFVAYMAYKPEYRRREVASEGSTFGGKLPNENLPAYMKVSPINYVDQIETPLLILATTGDKIAPLTLHTGRLIDALKARNKVYEAKIYDNAPGGHIFMHGASPEHEDGLNRVVAWLGKYLNGGGK